MNDTPARLLKLLSLLQLPREWPGSELAARLTVSPRTIRRDIERLRELGYPVEATMGAEGGYRLVAGTAMPPLLLDDEEAVAIAIGLRIASGHAVDGIDEASVRALTKLERVLPSRLRRRVSALGAATVPLLTGSGPAVDPAILTSLATAIANHESVRFAYETGEGTVTINAATINAATINAVTKRLVEPHRLVSAGRRWYLVGFDADRDDWRIYRVDRVHDLQPTGARFTSRDLPAKDVASYVTSKLHSTAPTYQAVAILHASADQITRKVGTSIGDLTPLDEQTCHLHSHADTLEWLAFRLTALGCEFEVESPPQLSDYLRALGARATRGAR